MFLELQGVRQDVGQQTHLKRWWAAGSQAEREMWFSKTKTLKQGSKKRSWEAMHAQMTYETVTEDAEAHIATLLPWAELLMRERGIGRTGEEATSSCGRGALGRLRTEATYRRRVVRRGFQRRRVSQRHNAEVYSAPDATRKRAGTRARRGARPHCGWAHDTCAAQC